jgi:hypothetical protein
MKIQLSIDRFEGKRKEIAVLVTDEGQQLNFPRALLPAGAKAGEVLTLDIERDLEATKQLRQETRKLQEELRKRDPGGDINL